MSRRMMLLLFPSSFFSLVYYCTLLGTMVWFGILRGGKWVRGAHKERRPKATLLHGGGKRQIRYKQSISRFGEGYSRKWGWGKCSLGPNQREPKLNAWRWKSAPGRNLQEFCPISEKWRRRILAGAKKYVAVRVQWCQQ